MSKKKFKCVLCGGLIIQNKVSEEYYCSKCKAKHAPELFNPVKRSGVKKQVRIRVRLLIAIIATLYLLWLAYRIFYY